MKLGRHRLRVRLRGPPGKLPLLNHEASDCDLKAALRLVRVTRTQ